MDTSSYFIAGYLAMWVIPTYYLIKLFRKIEKLERDLKKNQP